MSNQAALGWQNPGDFGSGFNSQIFLIWSILSRLAGSTLVEVKGVNATAGTVDIQPLVNQVDGYGNAVPHGVIYGCPYFQLQSGSSAVIIPPTVGDIGVAIFADRDISGVIANRKRSNPGSNRMFDYADGMYFGGMLNAVPTQFIQFAADGGGITITSPTAVTVNAPAATVNATTVAVNAATSTHVTTPLFTVTGNMVLAGTLSQTGCGAALFSGDISTTGNITSQGTVLHTHVHGGVTTGAGNTGAPV